MKANIEWVRVVGSSVETRGIWIKYVVKIIDVESQMVIRKYRFRTIIRLSHRFYDNNGWGKVQWKEEGVISVFVNDKFNGAMVAGNSIRKKKWRTIYKAIEEWSNTNIQF